MGNEIQKVEPNNVAMFVDMDFDTLNGAIEQLGTFSGKLTDKEKELAVNILTDWEKNVIDKVSVKKRELKDVISFVKGGYLYDTEFTFKISTKLAEVSNTEDLFNIYIENKQKLIEFEQEIPVKPLHNPSLTEFENDEIYRDYVFELTKSNATIKLFKYNMTLSHRQWFNKMKKSQEVITITGEMDAYLVKLTKYNTECKDKSQLAKVNISIANEDVRNSIKEIINFSKQLK